MWSCPVRTVMPFALMLAPVYVYLRRNGKYVSVKEPLDFFTEAELRKFQPYEDFYFPDCVASALPFRRGGQAVRSLLSWRTRALSPPAPYEISDAVLRLIGPLWGEGGVIEPFFVSVFVNELCELFRPELLLGARERDVDRFERAVFRSSWAVFVALHLSYCDLAFLNALRVRVFQEALADTHRQGDAPCEIEEIISLAVRMIPDNRIRELSRSGLAPEGVAPAQLCRVSGKMISRLARIEEQFVRKGRAHPTVFGSGGFQERPQEDSREGSNGA